MFNEMCNNPQYFDNMLIIFYSKFDGGHRAYWLFNTQTFGSWFLIHQDVYHDFFLFVLDDSLTS